VKDRAADADPAAQDADPADPAEVPADQDVVPADPAAEAQARADGHISNSSPRPPLQNKRPLSKNPSPQKSKAKNPRSLKRPSPAGNAATAS
jgi:hypothetical protein